ncbi:MAG: hypothetical protein WB646_20545 [Steroidobacteraceae bacterium]
MSKTSKSVIAAGMLSVFGLLAAATGMAQQSPGTPERRDGQRDFDFNVGTWDTHIRRLQQPLSGSSAWVQLNGTVTVHPIWDGRAQIEEIEADGATGHFEGLTLFLYNPDSHQWTQTYASSRSGSLNSSLTGAFKDGRGELIGLDQHAGRTILVRTVWSDIKPDSHRFEQSFSEDGGKTWEPNFVATLTRVH